MKQASYGSWKSPITTDMITARAISFDEIAASGKDIYWVESRPNDGGRYVIMHRAADGTVAECTPPEFYVRTTVHEYGGGAFMVEDGIIYFSNFKDHHLYRQRPNEQPEVITLSDGYYYADLILDKQRDRIICVREDHTAEGEAVNTIIGLSLSDGREEILIEGNNFYSSARLNPDGTKLAYLTWSHPNMPWDGCELWLADVHADGTLHDFKLIAGSVTESVFQPEWSPEGILHFIGESTGWWNLYRVHNDQIEALHPLDAEFGEPLWVFRMSTYGFVSETKIFCRYTKDGISHLAFLDTSTKELANIETSFIEFGDIVLGDGFASFIGGSPTQPYSLIRMDTSTCEMEIIKQAFEVTVDAGYLSIATPITFPTTDGKEAYAIYYAPKNKDYAGLEGECPPLMVISHGGPTGGTSSSLRLGLQYWTSRGFAVLDVNYGGSTGYGREYRQRLNGNWGIVDVDDCCNGALYMVEKGLADPDRLAIRGGSAGGYTTLACLAFRNDVFKAGASYYGISELEVFATDTHKFESRYMDSLIGPYPERKDLYFNRSPINFIKNLSCPIILFQGDEDKVVPPSQSQMMFEAVRNKELPVAYLLFEGEQHGFRKAETIKRSLEAEFYFYSKIFGFEPADTIEPVQIENL